MAQKQWKGWSVDETICFFQCFKISTSFSKFLRFMYYSANDFFQPHVIWWLSDYVVLTLRHVQSGFVDTLTYRPFSQFAAWSSVARRSLAKWNLHIFSLWGSKIGKGPVGSGATSKEKKWNEKASRQCGILFQHKLMPTRRALSQF